MTKPRRAGRNKNRFAELKLGVIALLAYPLIAGCANLQKREEKTAYREVCPQVYIEKVEEDGDVSFNDVERRLLCGDKDDKARIGEEWKVIPLAQAKFHMQAFLQDRAYYRPKFEERDGKLYVRLGEPTRVAAIRVEGAPPALDIGRRREILGARMTPAVLDEVEQWVIGRMHALGYACPQVSSQAQASTGEIRLQVLPGEILNVTSVVEEPIPGVEAGSFRRYDAFLLGKPFQGDFVRLTERRLVSESVVQSAHFEARCTPQGVQLRQETMPGLPRILTFRFGASTEEIPRVEVRWRNTRLGSSASLLDVTLLGSPRQQGLQGVFTWYGFPSDRRLYIRPSVELRHENEQYFESLSANARVAPGRTWDLPSIGGYVDLGPSLDLVRTLRGEGQPDALFLGLQGEIRAQTHYFEFYRNSPRAGFNSTLRFNLNSRKVLSDISAQRLEWYGETLWNYRQYDPPLWILGGRWGLGTTMSGESLASAEGLPATFRQYLGGIQDLRGFGRQELPGPTGALSAAFASVEIRAGILRFLPSGLQPLAFTDFGALGREEWSLDSPLYWSPGAGFRWETPFGVFRTTAAHGFQSGGAADRAQDFTHWQFYLSYGEEF